MVAKFSTKELAKVLKLCEAVADKKASMAVLSMVLLNVNPEMEEIELLATDLDQGFKGKIKGQIEGSNDSFCIPARKFYEIVKNFPEEEILLIKEGTRLVLKDEAERIKYEISFGSAEEFPSMPDFSEEDTVEIPGKDFSLLVEKTIFACAKEEARFVLSGIYFESLPEEGKIRTVASDGHRLALYEREVEEIKQKTLPTFILNRKSAKEMAELAEDELLVKLGFVNNYAVLFTSLGTFFSRTIEGSFPDYRAVIPQNFTYQAKVDRRFFMDALKRASLLISERFKPVNLTFNPNELILASQETELGSSKIKLGCEYEGPSLTINFNTEYLLDPLEVMVSEEVELKFKDERSPASITGYRDEGFLYIVMPMII